MEIAPFIPNIEPATMAGMFDTWQRILIAICFAIAIFALSKIKLSKNQEYDGNLVALIFFSFLFVFATSFWSFLSFFGQDAVQINNQKEAYLTEQTVNLENNGFTIIEGTLPTDFKKDGGNPDATQIKLSTSESLFDCVVSYPEDNTENLRFKCAQNETFDLAEIKGK